jgi:hypothetical protein
LPFLASFHSSKQFSNEFITHRLPKGRAIQGMHGSPPASFNQCNNSLILIIGATIPIVLPTTATVSFSPSNSKPPPPPHHCLLVIYVIFSRHLIGFYCKIITQAKLTLIVMQVEKIYPANFENPLSDLVPCKSN